MPNSLENKRRKYQKNLEEAVERIPQVLSRLPEVQCIILFGSYARGKNDLFTDLDILVIMNTEEDFINRITHLYKKLGGKVGVDMDIIAYTPSEIESMKDNGFVKKALKEGHVIYERK